MELFKRTILGTTGSSSSAAPEHDKGAETVEKLVERLRSATLLDDRRDACRGLRSLSKKYRVEVGAQGMDAILDILHMDRIDSEITEYALETLQNITSPELLDDEDESMKNVGSQFTEIFIKRTDNVATLLSTLEEYDFRIRLKLIRLLTNLLTNRPREMQEVLLVSPMGVSKMVDLLSDAREVVRNDALLLLIALTKNNASIQKIIAFENGFDKILQIIQEEGYSDGGPIVEDCLHLFLNLLRSNTSNQTFFREGSYTKLLLPFFNLPTDMDMGWPTQKVSNFYYMLRIVRTLVSPLNPSHVTHSCQRAMKQCGILELLSQILMANGVPVETLTEAIVTVGELIRGLPDNQEYFASVIAPSEPPRPALVLILMTLVNDRQLLSLRCAVLYCVQCYLYKNHKSQAEIISTLLPGTGSPVPGTVTAGQLICSGLFSRDTSVNWFSSIALSHVLLDSLAQKQSLLKVQLVTKAGQAAVDLLTHILSSLQQDIKTEVKLGFLQLLSIWFESCPEAISQFLSNSNSIPYLITQITSTESDEKECIVHGICAFIMGLCLYFNADTVPAYSKEALHQLITKRIGMETLTDGLNQISKSEPYLHSLKHPQLLAKHSRDMVFDHNFCLLFKKYESLILLQLNSETQGHHHHHQMSMQSQQHQLHPQQQLVNSNHTGSINYNNFSNRGGSPNEISRFQEFIRGQDEVIEKQKKEIQEISAGHAEYKSKYEESVGEVLQLKNQLALALAQNETIQMLNRVIPEDEHLYIVSEKDRRIEALELQLLKMEQIQQHHHFNGPSTNAVTSNPMQEELNSKLEEENKALLAEVERLTKDQEALLELLAEMDKRIPPTDNDGGVANHVNDLSIHGGGDENA